MAQAGSNQDLSKAEFTRTLRPPHCSGRSDRVDDNDFSDVLASAPEALAGDAADHAVAAPGYFFRLRGEQFGPVVIKELQDLIDGGTMTASDRIRRDDSAAWIPCGEIETLTFPRAVETAAAVRTPTPKQPVSPELSLADFPADFLETIGYLRVNDGNAGRIRRDAENVRRSKT